MVDVASECECEYANCGVAGRDLARVGGAGQTGAGCRVDTSLDRHHNTWNQRNYTVDTIDI